MLQGREGYPSGFIRIFLVATLSLFVAPRETAARLILDAEIRVTTEDNIVGLLTGGDNSSSDATSDGGTTGGGSTGGSSGGAGGGPGGGGPAVSSVATKSSAQHVTGNGTRSAGGPGGPGGNDTGAGPDAPSDLSVTIAAAFGASVDVGDALSLFAKGFAERTDYDEHYEYDRSVAGATAGLTVFWGNRLSVRLSGVDKIKRYDNDPDRDCTIYGGSVAMKQKLLPALWIRESAEYETGRAASPEFSYRGTILRFTAGYDLTDRVLVAAGYRFQTQHYQDAWATALRTGASFVSIDYLFTRRWSTGFLYERETTAPGTYDTITRNNICSLSLRFTY